MRRGLLAVAGSGVVVGSLYLAEALRYPRGSLAQPGPGLFPLLVGALLLVSAAAIGLEALLIRRDRPVDWPAGVRLRRFGLVGLATLGYIVLLPAIGHPLAGSLLLWVVLRVMGLRPWGLVVLLGVAMALGSYYLFGVLLGAPLPGGF